MNAHPRQAAAIGQREDGYHGKTEQGDTERERHDARHVGNETHKQRSDGTADDTHDEQRRGHLGVTAKATNGQGKDGGKHDALTQEADKEGIKAHRACKRHDDEH